MFLTCIYETFSLENSVSENDATRMNLVEVQSNIGTAIVKIVAFLTSSGEALSFGVWGTFPLLVLTQVGISPLSTILKASSKQENIAEIVH